MRRTYGDDYGISGRGRREVIDLRADPIRPHELQGPPDLFAVTGIAALVVTYEKGNIRAGRNAPVSVASSTVTFSGGDGTKYLVAEYVWATGALSVVASNSATAPDSTTYRKILHEFTKTGTALRHTFVYHRGSIELGGVQQW